LRSRRRTCEFSRRKQALVAGRHHSPHLLTHCFISHNHDNLVETHHKLITFYLQKQRKYIMAFCEHCIDLKELPGTPAGKDETIGGIPTYVSKGSNGKGSIVLATDIFGLGILNPKIVADKFSKQTGFTGERDRRSYLL
jgi:hypothetical protein